MAKVQDFAHHTRFSVLYHFITTPIALLNLYFQIRHAFATKAPYDYWNVVFAFGFLTLVLSARVMALTVQDRVIRLEMRLRLRELLPSSMEADIAKLTVRQLVALRFASDAELPELVQHVLKGELTGEKEIKAAVKNWQADWQRA